MQITARLFRAVEVVMNLLLMLLLRLLFLASSAWYVWLRQRTIFSTVLKGNS